MGGFTLCRRHEEVRPCPQCEAQLYRLKLGRLEAALKVYADELDAQTQQIDGRIAAAISDCDKRADTRWWAGAAEQHAYDVRVFRRIVGCYMSKNKSD